MIEVLVQSYRLLPPFFIYLLFKIAMPVKQRYRRKIQVKVARRLAMIAGKYSQASGVVRNRFMKPELCGKIGDPGRGGAELPVCIRPSHIGQEFLVDALHFAD